jgi:arylsulfatase A-like enzyme/predicted Zn-dependent protease
MRSPGSIVKRLSAAALAVLAAGCAEPPDSGERSLILITIDTIRADRIGAYGGTAVPTPNLDRLAREGTLFEDAFSTVPLTLPSHASILTGRYPASHGARHNGVYRLREAELTLAEVLREKGFRTAAFIGAYVLNRTFGTAQGFDRYDDIAEESVRESDEPINDAQRTADEVNAAVFEWLERPPEDRFLLWVHYYDPHQPYSPPEKPGRELVGKRYNREISYVDACIGDLVERLERQGLLDRSVLVIVGDHGESLGEHRESTHGIFLYESAMRVPMILRAPGLVPDGARIAGPVSTVDLAPTILELLDLPPLPDAQGRSLVDLMRGDEDASDAVVFAETVMPRLEFGWSELRMARDGRFKYIQAPREELYDLVEDPEELHNLAGIEEERRRALADRLATWVGETDVEEAAGAERALSEEELERLRSLGYLAGPAVEGGGMTGIDPKDGLGISLRIEEAKKLLDEDDREGAIEILHEVLAESPDNPTATAMMLRTLVQSERLDEAETVAVNAIEAGTAAEGTAPIYLRQTRLRLAVIYHMQGREPEAEQAYLQALDGWIPDTTADLPGLMDAVGPDAARRVFDRLLAGDPSHPIALRGLMELQLQAGDRAAATRTAERILRSGAAQYLPGPILGEGGRLLLDAGDPEGSAELFRIAVDKMGLDPDLMGYLGTALLSAGRVDEAKEALAQARRLRPEDPRPHLYLGNIALLRNQEDAARAHYDEALRQDPDFTEPLVNLALWLASQDRRDEAVAVLRDALDRNPDDARARDLLRKLGAGAGERSG